MATPSTTQREILESAIIVLSSHFETSEEKDAELHLALQEYNSANVQPTATEPEPNNFILFISFMHMRLDPSIMAVNVTKLKEMLALPVGRNPSLTDILTGAIGDKFDDHWRKIFGDETVPKGTLSSVLEHAAREPVKAYYNFEKGEATLKPTVGLRILKYAPGWSRPGLETVLDAHTRGIIARFSKELATILGVTGPPCRFISSGGAYFPSLLNHVSAASCAIDDLHGTQYRGVNLADGLFGDSTQLHAAPAVTVPGYGQVRVGVIHVLPFKPSGAVVSYLANIAVAYFESTVTCRCREPRTSELPSCAYQCLLYVRTGHRGKDSTILYPQSSRKGGILVRAHRHL